MNKIYSIILKIFSSNPSSLINIVLWCTLEIAIGTLSKYAFTLCISSENITQWSLMFMIGTKLFNQISTTFIKKRTMRISQDACYAYKEYKLCDFRNNVCQESKETMGVCMYEEKLENLCGKIDGVMEHFIPIIISTFASLSMAFFAFPRTQLWLLLILILIQLTSQYLFYIPSRDSLASVNKKFKKMRRKAFSLKSFALHNYDCGFSDFSDVKVQDDIIIGTHKEFTYKSIDSNNIISYTNIFTLCVISMLVIDNWKTVILATMDLTTDINEIIGCSSWLMNVDMCVGEFYDLEKKFTRREKPVQNVLGDVFVIDNICIQRGKREICYEIGSNKVQIKQGSRVLIRGSSGHGKSSFFKGLCGSLSGVLINNKESIHYMDNIVSLAQSGFLKFKELSLSEIFGLDDEYVIENICRMVMLDDWLNKKRFDEGNDFMKKPVELSGGEALRLTIGYKLFQAKKLNKPVIALDEPESGTDLFDPDSNDGYEMLKRIGEEFKGITLIVISHMYNANGEAHLANVRNRAVKWDNVITIKNFNVSVSL